MSYHFECASARERGDHEDATCFSYSRWVRLRLPDASGERFVWATSDDAWEYLDDHSFAAWRTAPYMVRCEMMGLCPMGLLDPAVTPDMPSAQQLLGVEGLCESFHVLPYPGGLLAQPSGLLEGFSVVREVRNRIQAYSMRESMRKAKGSGWSHPGRGA